MINKKILLKAILIGLIASLIISVLQLFSLFPFSRVPVEFSLQRQVAVILSFCIVFCNITIWYYLWKNTETVRKKSILNGILLVYLFLGGFLYLYYWVSASISPPPQDYPLFFALVVVLGISTPILSLIILSKIR